MKTITIIRKNFLMVVALATVIGFSAFKMAETTKSEDSQSQFWFAMDASGETPLPGPISSVDEICPDKEEQANCARLYNANQTTGSGNSRTVIPSEINNEVDHRTRVD
ncbi:hypothetical protein [Sphingobacterium allocomposti]|nr:hypothetical protein [Sphingobacterium composti Yoo et al. 2007 non Ten et al. 2007]